MLYFIILLYLIINIYKYNYIIIIYYWYKLINILFIN